jgi:hypothetical protein
MEGGWPSYICVIEWLKPNQVLKRVRVDRATFGIDFVKECPAFGPGIR